MEGVGAQAVRPFVNVEDAEDEEDLDDAKADLTAGEETEREYGDDEAERRREEKGKAVAVARDGDCDAGGLGDGAVLADEHVEHDAVDPVVLAVERHGAHDVVALTDPVHAALALFVPGGVPGQVVVEDC